MGSNYIVGMLGTVFSINLIVIAPLACCLATHPRPSSNRYVSDQHSLTTGGPRVRAGGSGSAKMVGGRWLAGRVAGGPGAEAGGPAGVGRPSST